MIDAAPSVPRTIADGQCSSNRWRGGSSSRPCTSPIPTTAAPGACAAIIRANDSTSTTVIDFKISESESAGNIGGDSSTLYYAIDLKTPLPQITKPVDIDANTQSGYTTGQPVVQLDGTDAGSSTVGLDFLAVNSQVNGLSVVNFHGGGIEVAASNVQVNHCWVGLDVSQDSPGNGHFGVEFTGGASNDAVQYSVVSANAGPGVEFLKASHGKVVGTYIGTTVDGNGSDGNQGDGVLITGGSSYNTIGGTSAALRDLISGNANNGVEITGSGTSHNLVEGDYIGTNSSGDFPLPNGSRSSLFDEDGVLIGPGASYNTVGGTTGWARDVISGNTKNGVEIHGSGAMDNVVEGDFIGTDYSGSHALGNGFDGVVIDAGASHDTVGGTSAASATSSPGTRRTASPSTPTTTWSRGTTSAPTPPALAPWPTATTACSSRPARVPTRSAGPSPAPETSSPATPTTASRSPAAARASTWSRGTISARPIPAASPSAMAPTVPSSTRTAS